ncbi:tRNA adenosine deaminase-associated protein [Pseudokineococcus basanitobsidens]|uniref:tRNA adenosine deaminase-associated protein n=1 Tax=Pseudokineococcus basanitobsidens TaxID=1926649 RepID=A0ABU8RKH5_9ACTN
MSYFTAVITCEEGAWRSHDVDVEDVTDLDDLADVLRRVAPDGGTALAVLEHEDEWFAVARLDGDTLAAGEDVDEEVRLFVSDLAASQRSHYGDLVAPAAETEAEMGDEPEEAPEEVTDPASRTRGPGAEAADGAPTPADDEEDEPDRQTPGLAPWAGDPDLLSDLGVDRTRLLEITEGAPEDPDSALAQIGADCGFDELLEALR